MTLNVHNEEELRKAQAALDKCLENALKKNNAELLPPASDVVSISRQEYNKLWETLSLFQTAITNCGTALGIVPKQLMTVTDVCHIAERISETDRYLRGEVAKAQAAMDYGADDSRWKPGETSVDALIRERNNAKEQYRNNYIEATFWKDKYNREVEGLNNEGDAIGGEPPSGMRHHIEYLLKENERLRAFAPPELANPQNDAKCDVQPDGA